MSDAVLLRFHKNLVVVRDRLRMLRRLNPDTPIYGLFGGDGRLGRAVNAAVGRLLDDLQTLPGGRAYWKWADGDHAFGWWWRNAGHRLPFERLLSLEWDQLVVAPLAELYAHVPEGAVGLTGLSTLAEAEQRWSWLRLDGYRDQVDELRRHVRERHGWSGELHTCNFGGAALPRRLVAGIDEIGLPRLAHDELRLPLVAQLLGLELVDTGFRRRDEPVRLYTTDNGPDIDDDAIAAELARPGGRRIFHPYRRPYAATPLESALASAVARARSAVALARR